MNFQNRFLTFDEVIANDRHHVFELDHASLWQPFVSGVVDSSRQ